MAALVWDAPGQHWYETGVSKVALYVQNPDGSYGEGVAWNGVTSVNESPDGADPNDLWADNIKYASLYSTETFGFTIEAYTYPDAWMQCDGQYVFDGGLRLGQQQRKSFGLCYRTEMGNDTATEGDDKYTLHLIYGAMAQPSDRDYETINDSPDAIQFSWECTTNPVSISYPSNDTSVKGLTLKPTSQLIIPGLLASSSASTSTNLKVLLDCLYGTSSRAAKLPTPSQVLSILYSGTLPQGL